MSEEKLKMYWWISTAYWKLFKKYVVIDPEDTDQYWQSIMEEADAIFQEGRKVDQDYTRDVCMATVDALERARMEVNSNDNT